MVLVQQQLGEHFLFVLASAIWSYCLRKLFPFLAAPVGMRAWWVCFQTTAQASSPDFEDLVSLLAGERALIASPCLDEFFCTGQWIHVHIDKP